MIPPTSTIPGSFMPSAMPGAGVFNPVGAQHQQSSTDKPPQSAETMEAASEITLQGKWVYKHILLNVNTSHVHLEHGMLLFFFYRTQKENCFESCSNTMTVHRTCAVFQTCFRI